MGANQAIESAVVLTNALYDQLQKKPNGLDLADIDAALTEFQAKRFERINGVYQAAYDTTRMEALDGLKATIIGRYIIPLLGQGLRMALFKGMIVTSPTLKFIKPTRPHEIPYLDEEQPHAGWFLSWFGF
jgi:2-polyprenyl-6-methoxyphenol hydroxylase-like FAD-dependent oxidoreductase